jgi:hypothetical protein
MSGWSYISNYVDLHVLSADADRAGGAFVLGAGTTSFLGSYWETWGHCRLDAGVYKGVQKWSHSF